jgi:hypothetical protein
MLLLRSCYALAQATFSDAQTLVLSGLTATAQSFGAGGATAVYPIQASCLALSSDLPC